MSLTEIQFPKHAEWVQQNKIIVAQPARDKGAVTVICGKNHSGKTYILKRVQRIVLKRNEMLDKEQDRGVLRETADDIFCNFSDERAKIDPVILITKIAAITELSKGTSTAQEVNNKNMNHFKGFSDFFVRFQIKEALEMVAGEFLDYELHRQAKEFDVDRWNDPLEAAYRLKILTEFPVTELALAPRSNPIVSLFEKLTQGRLYFGISTPQQKLPLFEFHLVFTGDIIIPYGSWSEGQKVLLSLLMLVHYKRPELLLFDEIENHLHPEYISAVLEFIKDRVAQTIITTHHPHIIFSVYADTVNYLDLEKTAEDFPPIIPYDRHSRMKPPQRTSQLLEKNYAKLISSYKLFDAYDNQLLRIASANVANLNELLTTTFTALFNYEVIAPSKSKKPDLQSQKLYDIFRNKLLSGPIKVLEYGAGEGRLLVDVNKILRVNEKERLSWCLYEPVDIPRRKIETVLESFPYPELVTVTGNPPQNQFDFIVIANVLHELTPDQISETIAYCESAIKSDGHIIIVELFPLLKPEQFAVPLSSREWKKLSRSLGFKAVAEQIVFKNASTEAYFVQLTKQKGQKANLDELTKIIVKFWNTEVLPDRSGDYSGRITLDDSDEIPRTLGALSTIASIVAYNFCDWRS
ncbi:MAG TPA: AAA family ATPase [Mucilaginibacter sp.]